MTNINNAVNNIVNNNKKFKTIILQFCFEYSNITKDRNIINTEMHYMVDKHIQDVIFFYTTINTELYNIRNMSDDNEIHKNVL